MNGTHRIAVHRRHRPLERFVLGRMPEDKRLLHIGPEPVNHLRGDTFQLPIQMGAQGVVIDGIFHNLLLCLFRFTKANAPKRFPGDGLLFDKAEDFLVAGRRCRPVTAVVTQGDGTYMLVPFGNPQILFQGPAFFRGKQKSGAGHDA